MPTLLDTERLRLRGIEERDAAPLLQLLNDPDWLLYVGDRGVHDEEQAKAYLSERQLGRPGQEHLGLYVVERKSDRAWLGINSFLQRSYLEHPDIGFAFLPIGRGQGYAYEASSGLLGYLRQQADLTRVLGTTVRENTSSIRLLEKLGLRFEREISRPGDRGPMQVYALDLTRA